MRCTQCGNEYENHLAACPYCGVANVTQGAFCPNCGQQIAPGSVVCGSCGAYLGGNKPRRKNNSGGSQGGNKGLIVAVAILATVVVCGLIGVLIYVLSADNKPEQIVVVPENPVVTSAPVQTATPTPPPAPERVIPPENFSYSDGYLFPSDRVYITEGDLYGLSKEEVAYVRNEIYARHGYIFQTEPYKSYFARKSWYYPNVYFDESSFSAVERANKEFIVDYEVRMGWR